MQYRSEKIKNRYIECSKNNELLLNDECEIIQYLFNKLNFVSLAEAAKISNISYNGMKKRVKEGKEMSIKVGNLIFVSI